MDLEVEELLKRLPEEIIEKLKNCRQDPIWHPEGSVYNHIQIVIENVKKLYNGDVDLLVAAVFHDLGKLDCQQIRIKDGIERISNIGHEHASLKYIEKYFDRFSEYTTNKEKITEIVANHMKAHLYISGDMKKENKRRNFENLKYFEDIIKFSKCDNILSE